MIKGLEELEHLYAKLSAKSSIDDISENLKEYDIIEKGLKALEIIREKEVNVGNLIHDIKEHGTTYEEYLDCYDYYQYGGIPLTQEEHDLLKEVLL